jgi:hypothetical protein
MQKVRLAARTWGGDVDETVWAERLTKSRVKLKNVPLYAYDVSYNDVLNVNEGQATGVTIRSGHSTYRFFVRQGQIERALGNNWKVLEGLGCTYERATEHLLAVDVPPESDIHAVYRALEAGENDGVWEFEEGHCGHAV